VELEAGDTLASQAGARIAAQWAESSGFLLLAESQLGLERLDVAGQTLHLGRGSVAARVVEPRDTLFTVTTPAHRLTTISAWFSVAAASTRTTVDVFEGTVEVASLDGRSITVLKAPAHGVFEGGLARTSLLSAADIDALRAANELNLLDGDFAKLGSSSGLLRLSSAPAGALRVDGVDLGSTPAVVRRLLGRHYLEVTRAGFAPTRRWVNVGVETGELHLALIRVPTVNPLPGAATIEEMVQLRSRQIRACYERSLKRDPSLEGTIDLRLKVGRSGRVEQASTENATLDDEQVSDCLVHEARHWSFSSGQNSTVLYPLVFRPL
jgi:hypothetical protein